MFQQAVAALLNACRAGQPVAGIITEVQNALNTCNRTTILNEAAALQSRNAGSCGGVASPTTVNFRQ
jgi:hypothetical protein